MSADPPGAEEGDETQVTGLSTMHGGKAASIVDSGGDVPIGAEIEDSSEAPPDLARAALTGAQGLTRPGSGRGRSSRRKKDRADGARSGGFSGPAPDDADPELVGSVLAGYVSERGWERPIATARVFTDWAELVGSDLAAHCRPSSLNSGQLSVEAESTAWATQLRLLSGTVLARLVAQLGPEVVTSVQFRGPTAPSWKHGGRSVRGARGPRDTYG